MNWKKRTVYTMVGIFELANVITLKAANNNSAWSAGAHLDP